MKTIRITIAGNDSTIIVLPIECAGEAATIMAKAEVFVRDGYYSTSGWKLADEGIRVSYVDDGELQPTDPKTKIAQDEAAANNTKWYKEYTERLKIEKELAEAKAQLEAIKSVTVCSVSEPVVGGSKPSGEEEES